MTAHEFACLLLDGPDITLLTREDGFDFEIIGVEPYAMHDIAHPDYVSYYDWPGRGPNPPHETMKEDWHDPERRHLITLYDASMPKRATLSIVTSPDEIN